MKEENIPFGDFRHSSSIWLPFSNSMVSWEKEYIALSDPAPDQPPLRFASMFSMRVLKCPGGEGRKKHPWQHSSNISKQQVTYHKLFPISCFCELDSKKSLLLPEIFRNQGVVRNKTCLSGYIQIPT